MNRVSLLIMILIAASGIWIAKHWDEVRVAVGIDDPVELRAVQIAKSDYSLARHLHNSAVIEEELAAQDGIEIIGWQAEPQNQRLYLVKFLYKKDGRTEGYYFEVDVGKTAVRFIERDSELAIKYGVGSPPR